MGGGRVGGENQRWEKVLILFYFCCCCCDYFLETMKQFLKDVPQDYDELYQYYARQVFFLSFFLLIY